MAIKNSAELSFEESLWKMGDKLRGSMDAAEYKHIILGLLFLKFIYDAFEELHNELSKLENRDPENKDEYKAQSVFWVPKEARWSNIKSNAKNPEIGQIIDNAMRAVENENKSLKDVLPKEHGRSSLDKKKLGELIELFTFDVGSRESRSKDVLGRVYEYFLSRFASAEGKNGGEFYTPNCIVRLLVEMIEPYNGRIYDPCCGSGGMFVQSEKFVLAHSGKVGDISIYGQESNPTTWKLCKMNLTIRGIDGNIGEHAADTLHNDLHKSLRARYILANPPFNISDWGSEELKDDKRWMYGLPPNNNANYGWIQHIMYHLARDGTAGIVIHGGASTNKGTELEIREKIIKNNWVECIVQLPTQLFYNVSLPVQLFILSNPKHKKATPKLRDRTNEILMIDASQLGEMVDSTHRELKDEEIHYVANIFKKWRYKEHDDSYQDIPGVCVAITVEEALEKSGILAPNRYVSKPRVSKEVSLNEDIKDDVTSLYEALSTIKTMNEKYNFVHNGPQDILNKLINLNFGEDLKKDQWETVPVSEVIDSVIGGTWGKEEPAKGYMECKVIRGTDFPNIPYYKIEKVPTRYIKKGTANEKRLKPGDLVVEMSGGSKAQATGRCVFITEEFLDLYNCPVVFSNFSNLIRVKEDKIRPLWFYWYWQQSYHEGLTAKYENQPSGIKNFQLDEYMENELISLPSVEVQDQVIEMMGDFHKLQNIGRKMSFVTDDLIGKSFERLYYKLNE